MLKMSTPEYNERDGIFAVPVNRIETPKNGDTVYVDLWWCADDKGNVYFTDWGMPLAYKLESSCRLVGSRFGLHCAIHLILAYVTPDKYKSADWQKVDFQ